ncbi:MAG: DEAD/DEAH box helicase family protein, partial [Thermoguttaceae bacterium]|nr:DEAD/DEAH box helicase family protein [Thermoguttaceae bacterium]
MLDHTEPLKKSRVPLVIRTWNHQCKKPEIVSMFPGQKLLDQNGRQVSIGIHSMNVSRVFKTVLRIFSLPVYRRTIPIHVDSFFFYPFPDFPGNDGGQKPDTADRQPGHDGEPAVPAVTSGDSRNNEYDLKDGDDLLNVTRIRIPNDIIKLEDRLQYVLQPPLETLLGRNSLEMPFVPFGYQKQGIAFLYSAHFAVLADEMGLGKTMQAITTVRLLLRSGECRRVLLVCPKPLVSNWKREFELWAPEIAVQVIEGKGERRKWLWQLADVPVRIANYELLNRDREYYDLPGESDRFTFDLVILDESQRIKNRQNATSEAARAIPRRRNWALTGTPVENSSEDLVGIFEFLSPGYLESGLKPTQISRLVGEHILRRTKDEVLTDLPPRLIRDAHVELQGEQWETYRLAQEAGEIRLNEMGDSATLRHAFELILRLKQICNFDPVTGDSAKMERLIADLDEVTQSGHKAIIFSQWVETLLHIKEQLRDFHPVEYHGRIPHRLR